MKLAAERAFAAPEAAARKLVELAKTIEAVQDGRIHIVGYGAGGFAEHKEKAIGLSACIA